MQPPTKHSSRNTNAKSQDKFDATTRSQSFLGNFEGLHFSDAFDNYLLQRYEISFLNAERVKPNTDPYLADDYGYPFLQFYAFFGYKNNGEESGIEEKNAVPKIRESLLAK